MDTRERLPEENEPGQAHELETFHAHSPYHPTIRLHLWLENQGELFFGIGRAQLLFNIQQQGSIKKAAASMGMSYRAAWGKIQQSELALGLKLIESRGSKRDGVRLTPAGEDLADMFLAWFTAVEQCAVNSANSIFPFEVTAFDKQES
jgi:molybdate transport system regulatory protein